MNKLQRIIVVCTGVTICLVQFVSIFNDDLSENRGWAISFCLSAALLYLGFSGVSDTWFHHLKSAIPLLSKKKVPTQNNDIEHQTKKNIQTIIEFVDNLSLRMFAAGVDIQTTRGSLTSATSEITRAGLLLYIFTLHTVCKFKNNSNYLQTNEYEKTKVLIICQAFTAYASYLGISFFHEKETQFLNGLSNDVTELENGVRDFVGQLSAGNMKTPAAKINKWLQSKVGITSKSDLIFKQTLDEFTQDNLFSINKLILENNA